MFEFTPGKSVGHDQDLGKTTKISEYISELRSNNRVVDLEGDKYIQCGDTLGWLPLSSAGAMVCIRDENDINAPVNFATAVSPYLKAINALSWPLIPATLSFSVGGYKYV